MLDPNIRKQDSTLKKLNELDDLAQFAFSTYGINYGGSELYAPIPLGESGTKLFENAGLLKLTSVEQALLEPFTKGVLKNEEPTFYFHMSTPNQVNMLTHPSRSLVAFLISTIGLTNITDLELNDLNNPLSKTITQITKKIIIPTGTFVLEPTMIRNIMVSNLMRTNPNSVDTYFKLEESQISLLLNPIAIATLNQCKIVAQSR